MPGLEALDEADTVLVPPTAEKRFDFPPALLDALRRAHDRGARVASVCTGAFVLAAAGLLDGRPAITHWADVDELARRHPSVNVQRTVLYVDDGDVLTSAGVAAGLDLCLHLVRRDHGSRVANVVARYCLVRHTATAGRRSTCRRRSPLPAHPGSPRASIGLAGESPSRSTWPPGLGQRDRAP